MISETLNRYVILSLHWTERVKTLTTEERRKVNAEQTELYWYGNATAELFQLYSEIIDPNTSYQFHYTKEQIAQQLAWQVECLIYRLQEISQQGTAERKKLAADMLSALNKVSDYMLPIAVPLGIYVPVAKTMDKASVEGRGKWIFWMLCVAVIVFPFLFFTTKDTST